MIKSTMLKIFSALLLISARLPIGVATIYKPLSRVSISIIFIFIVSCSPANNYFADKTVIKNGNTQKNTIANSINEKIKIQNEIEIILPEFNNPNITRSLINSFELSIYEKKINNVSLNINRYSNLSDLDNLLKLKAQLGKVFIGTLSFDATELVKSYCSQGILFFSFASNKDLAGECVYLINFFPEDDLNALFNFFPDGSRIALLYPENFYGNNISRIIDPIASKSKSLIISRATYEEDLTNARKAIKELSKYEFRKNELSRQKKILKSKNDNFSKKALKKIQRFETAGNVDFTHIIIPDYSIRLLQIAPLLPFYDVDPKKTQFVGTGVWDDKAFFDEPSLQGAIFSGIEEKNRKFFFDKYESIYFEKPIRTATIPYDLIGIISYIMEKKMTLKEAYQLLDNGNIKFDGIDGKFYFLNNSIFRELDILQIEGGKTNKLN